MHSNDFDITIIGAGVVGLAIAARLAETMPGSSILIIERNGTVDNNQARRALIAHGFAEGCASGWICLLHELRKPQRT